MKRPISLCFVLLLECNYFFAPCTSQFMQPQRLMDRIRTMHETSNKLIYMEDSMSLNVDISEAKKYPPRDDLNLRIFNKDSNTTVCYGNMVDHIDLGKFQCTFLARDADLRHGANRFEFEVFSATDGKRYATQKIPDIHLFDHYLLDGYYDDFYKSDKAAAYSVKMAVSTLAVLLLAFVIDVGPPSIANEISGAIQSATKVPLSVFSKIAADLYGSVSTKSAFLGGIFPKSLAIIVGLLSAGISASSRITSTTCSSVKAGSDALVSNILSGLHKTISVAGDKSANQGTVVANLITASQTCSESTLTKCSVFIRFIYELFEAGLSSPAGMLVSAFEFGFLYFLSLVGKMKEVIFVENSSSPSGGSKPSPPHPRPPASKKVGILSVVKSGHRSLMVKEDRRSAVPPPPPTPKAVPVKKGKRGKESVEEENSPIMLLTMSPHKLALENRPPISRKLVKSFWRTACLGLAILVLRPRSGETVQFLKSLPTRVRESSVLNSLQTKTTAFLSYCAQNIQRYSRGKKSPDSAPIPMGKPLSVFLGRHDSQIAKGCPFFKR